MTDWYLIVILSIQTMNGSYDLKLNEFHRDTQDQCQQELGAFEEHYEKQLGKEIIDRVNKYGNTWYMHKKIVYGPVVGYTIKCESVDRSFEAVDQPPVLFWLW